MSLILLVDSVHTELAVALIREDSARFMTYPVRKAHDKNINRLVKELLEKEKVGFSDLNAYAVVVGPGSWTGCRVGVAAIKGFAMAIPKPVVAINSLDALGDPSAIKSNLDNYYIKRGSKYTCEKLESAVGFATLESVGIENYRTKLINMAKTGKQMSAKEVQPFYLTDFVVKS